MSLKKRKDLIVAKHTRKKIEISFDEIDKLFMAGCNGSQVASYFEIKAAELYELIERETGMPYVDYMTMKREKGDCGILVKQHTLAMAGNVRMLTWVGKNRLGQSDSIKQTIESDAPVVQKFILELPDNGRRFVEDEDQTAAGAAD